MGIVYRALDTLLAREVALKVARPDAESGGSQITPPSPWTLRPQADASSRERFDEMRARFLNEACVTGGLEHPAVAPVYDVGETENGLPFYTMRLVPGHRTLHDAIVATSTLSERLALIEPFLKVCDAMAYAHDRGIVHRDLKSENVALGEYGEVVVLDWGLATPRGSATGHGEAVHRRLMEQREALDFHTRAGALGTPGWMAPECLLPTPGQIDPRSDVFGLGVMLYAILTGRLPWPHGRLAEYATALTAGEAPSARQLEPAVPSALSQACAHALRRSPSERMASAADLAQAVRAWRARAASEGERAARRRTQRRVALAAALLLTAGAGSAVVLIESSRRESEAARRTAELAHTDARIERARAEEAMRFMVFDLRERLEPIGRLDLLAAVAERARAHYAGSSGRVLDMQEDLTRAAALRAVGEVLEARGDLPGALESFRSALAAVSKWEAQPGCSTTVALEASIDRQRIARIRESQGHRTESLLAYRGHVDDLQQLYARAPDDPAVRTARIHALSALSRALLRQGDTRGALDCAAQASNSAEEFYAQSPHDPTRADLLVGMRLEQAQMHARHQEPQPAIALARHALEQARSLASDDPADLRWSRRMAEAHTQLVLPLSAVGDSAGAEEAFRDAMSILEREAAADPIDERWPQLMVLLAARVAEARIRARNFAAAVELLKQALTKAERLSARDPSSGHRLHLVVDVTDRLSTAQAALGETQAALETRRRNVEASQALSERDPANPVFRMILAYNGFRLGETSEEAGQMANARDAFDAALPLLVQLAGELPEDPAVHAALIACHLGAGRVHVALGQRQSGLAQLRQGVERATAAAAALPGSELPFRLLQARHVLAMHLDREHPDERIEGLKAVHKALAQLRASEAGSDGAGAAPLRQSLERLLEDFKER